MQSSYQIFFENKDITDIELPKIRFKKINDISYEISFVIPQEIKSDVNSEEIEDKAGTDKTNNDNGKEGKVKYYYGKKYERDPENRRKAIEYHGTVCKICKFDFEKAYGERGRGYIEIHHIKPLSILEEKTIIDPINDLIPVCANCHRMIHRQKDNILSVNDMKELVKSQYI